MTIYTRLYSNDTYTVKGELDFVMTELNTYGRISN